MVHMLERGLSVYSQFKTRRKEQDVGQKAALVTLKLEPFLLFLLYYYKAMEEA
jgi:hypothetical protein